MYGSQSLIQATRLGSYVYGRRVVDVGCGDGERTSCLLDFGASAVLAIDKEKLSPSTDSRLTVLSARFTSAIYDVSQFAPDVMHVAWPEQHPRGLVELIEKAPIVIYVGKNTDGTACGSPELFQHFRKRRVLAYVPERANTLIVYGRVRDTLRDRVWHEEYAGLRSQMWESPLYFNPSMRMQPWDAEPSELGEWARSLPNIGDTALDALF